MKHITNSVSGFYHPDFVGVFIAAVFFQVQHRFPNFPKNSANFCLRQKNLCIYLQILKVQKFL